DGLLARYDLVTLADDKRFFPPYDAAAVVSPRLARDRPDAITALSALSGRLDVSLMRALNKRVEVDREDVASVARDALQTALGSTSVARAVLRDSRGPTYAHVGALAARHLLLVAIALLAAILVAVPLGLVLERGRKAAEPVIGT